MRVLLVAANTERLNMPAPPLGAAMVAAAARRHGHHVEFLDLAVPPGWAAALREAITGLDPEVVAISVRNIDDQDMARPVFLLEKVRDVTQLCREATTAPIVLGGSGYSVNPGPVLDYLGGDFGIAGEGERAFPELLECLCSGGDPSSIEGVSVAGGCRNAGLPPPGRLDDFDYPHKDLRPSLDLADPDLWVPVQTRRGCPLDCLYCSTPNIEGRRPRSRSLDLVMDDLRLLADAGVRRVQFVDNTFNLPPEYALQLCRGIISLDLGFEWRAITYPHRVTLELAEAMAEAGCVETSIGSESGSDHILSVLNKRFSTAEVRETVTNLRSCKIQCDGFLLLGVPGETVATVAASLEFVDSLGLDSLRITIGARIYPRTPLAHLAVDQGVIAADDDLLEPSFYMAPSVADRIEDMVRSREWSLPVFM